MQVYHVSVQIILLSSIIGNVLFSFYLDLHRPGWLLPSIALALLSLVLLLVFAFAEVKSAWFWVVVIYSVIYPCSLILLWQMFFRKQSRGIPSATTGTPL